MQSREVSHRRVTGHGGGAALCVPRSETAAMPRLIGARDGVMSSLRDRLDRRERRAQDLLVEAERCLARRDWNGYRRLDQEAWAIRMRNFRVALVAFRIFLTERRPA